MATPDIWMKSHCFFYKFLSEVYHKRYLNKCKNLAVKLKSSKVIICCG